MRKNKNKKFDFSLVEEVVKTEEIKEKETKNKPDKIEQYILKNDSYLRIKAGYKYPKKLVKDVFDVTEKCFLTTDDENSFAVYKKDSKVTISKKELIDGCLWGECISGWIILERED